MADWRQIQARIRKAKNGRDPSAKLSELYQRTRDAMVAWELAAIEERAERQDEAAKWYTIAAQRFRRADWKKKAEEALTRLGAPLPSESPRRAAEEARETQPEEGHAVRVDEPQSEHRASEIPQEEPDYESQTKFFGSADLGQSHDDQLTRAAGEISTEDMPARGRAPREPVPGAEETGRRRRRGRRGGRGRRRRGTGGAPGLPSSARTESAQASGAGAPEQVVHQAEQPEFERSAYQAAESGVGESPAAVGEELPAPQLPSERTARGRAGDPGLASRMNHLESLLRRLLGGALHRLREADEAPAGPGVFLLSDSDQITSYYVESCQTLRVAIANLARGRGAKNRPGTRGVAETDLKAKLAEHLGINEAKVAQYLKDHCVVRWIQLDDEAAQLAHFAIAVLRTPLNLP